MKHPLTKYIPNTKNTINAMRYKRVVLLKNVQKHLSAQMLQYILHDLIKNGMLYQTLKNRQILHLL